MKEKSWIIKQGVFLSIVSILISAISFFKEAIFANYFGLTSTADAYTIAIQIPEIIFAIVWEAINAIVIPLYTEKYYKEGKNKASIFLSTFITIITLGTALFIIFSEIFAKYLIYLFSPGFNLETHSLAVSLLRWILPVLFFESIVRISIGVLNIYKQFIIPKLINSVRNIAVIIFLVFFSNKFGIYAAAYGILTGMILECIMSLLFTSKYERYKPNINLKDKTIKKAKRMIIPLLVGIGVNEINQISDKFIASFLGNGSIAAINYSSKLTSIIQTIFLSNIITIMYPKYSSLASQEKINELSDAYSNTLKATILIGMPIIFGCVFLRNEMVLLAFKRGTFNDSDVIIVSSLFTFYLISALFSTFRSISTKIFTCFGDTKTAMYNSIIGVVINIILNIILSYYFGTIGLAISTMTSTIIISIILMLTVKKKVLQVNYKDTINTTFKSLMAAITMVIVLHLSKAIIVKAITLSSIITIMIYCLIQVLMGCCIYILVLIKAKVISRDMIKEFFKSKKI